MTDDAREGAHGGKGESRSTSTADSGRRIFSIGLCTALTIACGAALLDWVALTQLAVGCPAPGRVMLGTVGRVLMIHASTVLPILVVASLAIGMIARWRGGAAPDGVYAAIGVLVVGCLVGYGSLAQKDALYVGPLTITAKHVLVGTVIGAVVIWGVLRRLGRTRWRGPYHRLLFVTGPIGLLVFVAAPFLMSGTPLAGPGVYRTPTTVMNEQEARTTGPPNVLFVVLDTVRADRLSHHGHSRDTTPFLAELSAKGAMFERAIAPGMYTTPSHASMFTGLAVEEHGVGSNREVGQLDGAFETFAEKAQTGGYQTVAFSCNPYVDNAQNLLQGYEATVRVWGTWQWTLSFMHHWLFELGWGFPADWFEYDFGAAMMNCLVADWVENGYRADQPYLLFLNYMEAHRDISPPHTYRELYLDEAGVERSYELMRDSDVLVAAESEYWIVPPETIDEADRVISEDLYDASLRYQDDRLRELFAMLESNRLLENTLVVIVSDHGEGFGEHGIYQHHSCVYDILVHVPLTLLVPAQPGTGQRVADPVSTAVLYDLVCDAIALEKCPDTDTFAEMLVDHSARDLVVSECSLTTPSVEERAPEFGIAPNMGILRTFRSISQKDLKYILASDGRAELYEVSTDPQELTDLAAERPNFVGPFTEAMEQWLSRTKPRYGEGAVKPVEVDQRQLDLIKKLGYAGD